MLEWADIRRAAYDVPLSYDTVPVPGVVLDELGCWGLLTPGSKGIKDAKHPVHEMLLRSGELCALFRVSVFHDTGVTPHIDCSYTDLPPDALIVPDHYHIKLWSMNPL